MATIGGKTFESLGLKIEQSYQRPGPETRDYTLTIDGKHGAWDFGADLEPKNFQLPCTLTENTQEAMETAINNLQDHLFDSTGRPKTMELVFDDEPEKYYMVRFKGYQPISRIVSRARFSLPLTAFDPFKYAPSTAYDPKETYYWDSGLQWDSGLMYDNPLGFQWKYRRQYIGLYNYSGIETPIQVVIQGTVINPRITNQTTGQKLTVGDGLIEEYLEVDSNWYYAKETNSGKDSFILGFLHGEFANLSPGKNSLLLEGGIPNANVSINWLHKFI